MGTELAGRARCRRLRVGLGTFLAIEAAAASPGQANEAIEGAFAAMLAVERRMHPVRRGSDLARINSMAAHPSSAIPVDRSTWQLLQLAKHLHELSDGVFDPCLPCRPGGLTDIELLPDFNVRCHSPVELDFGGFAKGYAVDRAIETLMHHGCDAGLVNAGGDLRVFGSVVETILLRENGRTFRPLRLSNAAIAVSDTNESRRPPEHAGYYLRTEKTPGPDVVGGSVAVVAGQTALADALTKCALLCTKPSLERLIRGLRNTSTSSSSASIHVHCAIHSADIPRMRSR